MLNGEIQEIAILVQDRRHQMKEMRGREECTSWEFLLSWGERHLASALPERECGSSVTSRAAETQGWNN